MRIAVLGTGDVGKALAKGLARHGHDVTMGGRKPDQIASWAAENKVKAAGLADAARQADIVVLAAAWEGVPHVLDAVAPHVAKKVLIDVTNPLRHGNGPPELAVAGNDSAGEMVQRLVPQARVVKCWNIVGNPFMIDPVLSQRPTMWIAGQDAEAKQQVSALLHQVGWQDVIDLGGIDCSRYLEGLAMVWIRTYVALGHGRFAMALVRA